MSPSLLTICICGGSAAAGQAKRSNTKTSARALIGPQPVLRSNDWHRLPGRVGDRRRPRVVGGRAARLGRLWRSGRRPAAAWPGRRTPRRGRGLAGRLPVAAACRLAERRAGARRRYCSGAGADWILEAVSREGGQD